MSIHNDLRLVKVKFQAYNNLENPNSYSFLALTSPDGKMRLEMTGFEQSRDDSQKL